MHIICEWHAKHYIYTQKISNAISTHKRFQMPLLFKLSCRLYTVSYINLQISGEKVFNILSVIKEWFRWITVKPVLRGHLWDKEKLAL